MQCFAVTVRSTFKRVAVAQLGDGYFGRYIFILFRFMIGCPESCTALFSLITYMIESLARDIEAQSAS